MPPSRILELSRHFEIGGHTLNHIRLNIPDLELIKTEVEGSFNWLKELMGYNPVSFCFPGGKYNALSARAVFDAGYQLARTTELLSTSNGNHNILPTTVQVYQHPAGTYIRHLIKRRRWQNLYQWLQSGSGSSLEALTNSFLDKVEKNEGVFHLWGHSWEIEERGLWKKLEFLLKILSERKNFDFIQNKHLVLDPRQKPRISEKGSFLQEG